MQRWLGVALVVALLAASGTAAAAATHRTQLDWTEGRFEAGLAGAGEFLFPEGVPAPDHERLDVEVSPCHRALELDLLYHPPNASVFVNGSGGSLPFRFRYSLYAPDGARLFRHVVDEPDHNYPLPLVDEPGNYTLQLELIEGALVEWRARVQGFNARDGPGGATDPTCDLWLNEAETHPAGGDAEWVELYNERAAPLELDGWSVRVQAPNLTRERAIPNGTEVPADGHALVDLGTDDAVPDENASLELVPPVGGELDASPRLDDPAGDRDTHQRVPDGGRDWRLLAGTPGAANG